MSDKKKTKSKREAEVEQSQITNNGMSNPVKVPSSVFDKPKKESPSDTMDHSMSQHCLAKHKSEDETVKSAGGKDQFGEASTEKSRGPKTLEGSALIADNSNASAEAPSKKKKNRKEQSARNVAEGIETETKGKIDEVPREIESKQRDGCQENLEVKKDGSVTEGFSHNEGLPDTEANHGAMASENSSSVALIDGSAVGATAQNDDNAPNSLKKMDSSNSSKPACGSTTRGSATSAPPAVPELAAVCDNSQFSGPSSSGTTSDVASTGAASVASAADATSSRSSALLPHATSDDITEVPTGGASAWSVGAEDTLEDGGASSISAAASDPKSVKTGAEGTAAFVCPADEASDPHRSETPQPAKEEVDKNAPKCQVSTSVSSSAVNDDHEVGDLVAKKDSGVAGGDVAVTSNDNDATVDNLKDVPPETIKAASPKGSHVEGSSQKVSEAKSEENTGNKANDDDAVKSSTGGAVTNPALYSGGKTIADGGKTTTDGGKTTPNGGKTTPDGGKTTPDGGKTTPDGGKTTPDGGKTTPDEGKTTPDGGKTIPDGGKTIPDGGKTTPDGGKTTPDGGKTTPDGGKTTPDGGKTTLDEGKTTLDVEAKQVEEARSGKVASEVKPEEKIEDFKSMGSAGGDGARSSPRKFIDAAGSRPAPSESAEDGGKAGTEGGIIEATAGTVAAAAKDAASQLPSDVEAKLGQGDGLKRTEGADGNSTDTATVMPGAVLPPSDVNETSESNDKCTGDAATAKSAASPASADVYGANAASCNTASSAEASHAAAGASGVETTPESPSAVPAVDEPISKTKQAGISDVPPEPLPPHGAANATPAATESLPIASGVSETETTLGTASLPSSISDATAATATTPKAAPAAAVSENALSAAATSSFAVPLHSDEKIETEATAKEPCETASNDGRSVGTSSETTLFKKEKKKKKEKKSVFESTPKASKADAVAGMRMEIPPQTQSIFEIHGLRKHNNVDFKASEKAPERLDEKSVFEAQKSTCSNADFRACDKPVEATYSKSVFEYQKEANIKIDARAGEALVLQYPDKSVFEAVRSEKSNADFRASEKLVENRDVKSVFEVQRVQSQIADYSAHVKAPEPKEVKAVFEVTGLRPVGATPDYRSSEKIPERMGERTVIESVPPGSDNAVGESDEGSAKPQSEKGGTPTVGNRSVYENSPINSKAFARWNSKTDEPSESLSVFENKPAELNVSVSWRSSVAPPQAKSVYENAPQPSRAHASENKVLTSSSEYESDSDEDDDVSQADSKEVEAPLSGGIKDSTTPESNAKTDTGDFSDAIKTTSISNSKPAAPNSQQDDRQDS